MNYPDEEFERDFGALLDRLPESLRKDWVVIPRHAGNQVFIVGLLLGSSISLFVVGEALNIPSLRWTLVGVLLGLRLAAKFWPWWREDRYLRQLRDASRTKSGTA